MKINRRFFILILLLAVLGDESEATCSVWGIRRLISEAPLHDSPPLNIPPVPSPNPNAKEPKTFSNDGDKSTNDKLKDLPVSNDSEKLNSKSSNKNDNKTPVAGPPTGLPPVDGEKKDVKKEKNEGNSESKSANNWSCEGSSEPCKLLKDLTACIQSLESGSSGLVLIIQNEGESTQKVNITMPTSLTNVVDAHVIPEKQTVKIPISSSAVQGSKILLKSGDKECTLRIVQETIQSNFLQQLPFYYKQITPIYIAYFIFLVALIIGGICACCQLRKRKRQDGGVPYQELEMGISESVSANNVETADGWDDGWDDDWDEDKAVKSPGHRVVGISANGLTARTSKQDGWGKDWDD